MKEVLGDFVDVNEVFGDFVGGRSLLEAIRGSPPKIDSSSLIIYERWSRKTDAVNDPFLKLSRETSAFKCADCTYMQTSFCKSCLVGINL